MIEQDRQDGAVGSAGTPTPAEEMRSSSGETDAQKTGAVDLSTPEACLLQFQTASAAVLAGKISASAAAVLVKAGTAALGVIDAKNLQRIVELEKRLKDSAAVKRHRRPSVV